MSTTAALKVTLSFSLLFSLFVLAPVVAGDDPPRYRPSETNASGDPSQQAVTAAAAKDLVTDKLPGQPAAAALGFKHYAGYVTVNKTNGRALFYWFFESLTMPQQKPLLLWLNGGPGCSSVGYGESQEIGPFLIDGDGGLLKINPSSWNTEANLLFLESPIGVGFSYSNTSTDYVNLGDEFAANDAYTFLNNWYLKFPSYRNRPFYIAGESYAGKYIPELADLILEKNKKPSSSSNLSTNINLKGIMIGNPETSDADDLRGMVDYAWSHAVISDETHRIIGDNCNFSSSDVWSNKTCRDGVDEMYRQYDEIDIYSLYTPKCLNNLNSSSSSSSSSPSPSSPSSSSSSSSNKMGKRRRRRVGRRLGLPGCGYDQCLDDHTTSYFKRGDVQKVLHASDGLHVKNWTICNDTIFSTWVYQKESVLPIYRNLIAAGLKIWLYSGDTDGRVPVLSTRYSIAALGLPITKPWAPSYSQKQVSGWVEEYEGLTFVTVRGAGHDVPTFKPAESLVLFSSFISGRPLPLDRGL